MVACLVLGIYGAYAKGGDTRQLTATVFKYIVVAFTVAELGKMRVALARARSEASERNTNFTTKVSHHADA